MLPVCRLPVSRHVPAQRRADVEQGPEMAAHSDQDEFVERPPASKYLLYYII